MQNRVRPCEPAAGRDDRLAVLLDEEVRASDITARLARLPRDELVFARGGRGHDVLKVRRRALEGEVDAVAGPVRLAVLDVVRLGAGRSARELSGQHEHGDEGGDEERELLLHESTVGGVRQASIKRLKGVSVSSRPAMSSEYIFTMYRVDKFYGPDRQVLANISLSFFAGAKIGVLGPNGAGKSTVLRIMAGKEEPSSGVAELSPNATVGLLEQEPDLDPARTVRENVEDGVRALRDLLDRFNEISAKFAEPDADFDALLAEQGKVQDAIDRADAWQLDQAIAHAMDALRVPEGDRDVTTLSGGERRRVALCRLLLSAPDLLLLDEPTNHLDAESVAWLERFLGEYKGTVVAVTHDRYFLDNVAGWILELDRGRGIPYEGNYSSWLEQKQERLAVEEKQESARQRTLKQELEWVRSSPKARHAKS